MHRRDFLGRAAAALALPAAGCASRRPPLPRTETPVFRISLAQWSLHRALYAGDLDPADFPRVAREDYGLEGVEYVNSFYRDHAGDEAYFRALRDRATGHGVTSLLIMVDGEGALGDPDEAARAAAVDNHRPWLDAARILGCHAIRVNAASSGPRDEQQRLAADGLRRLVEVAEPYGLSVIVENHGGWSSDGAWLAGVMALVDDPRCGTLPDFGNFLLREDEWYDRYRGVEELMPYAKAVSAKSHDFDGAGSEVHTDYRRMMRIVLDAGYRGWVGVEYEGESLPEPDGIRATKRLLEQVREELAPAYG